MVGKALFYIQCMTCQARLAVRDSAAIGNILLCPKCQSFVEVVPPPGWEGVDSGQRRSEGIKPLQEVPEDAPLKDGKASKHPSRLGEGPQIMWEQSLPSAPPKEWNKIGRNGNSAPLEKSIPSPPPCSKKEKGVSAGEEKEHLSPSFEGGQTTGEAPRDIISPPVIWRPMKGGSFSAPTGRSSSSQQEVEFLEKDKVSPLPSLPPSPNQQKPGGQKVREGFWSRFFPLLGYRFPPSISPWVVIAIAPLAGALLAAGVLAVLWPFEQTEGFSPPQSPPEPSQQEDQSPSSLASPLPQQSPGTLGPNEPTKPFDLQWIPDPTGLVVAVRWDRLSGQEELLGEGRSFWSAWFQVGREVVASFRFAPEKVRQIVWWGVDAQNGPLGSVIMVELAEEALVAELSQRGQEAGFRVGQAPCRVEPRSGWKYPFVPVGSRWVLTGPEVLLRHLAQRAKPQLQSRWVARMVAQWPAEADVGVVVDAGWLRGLARTYVHRFIAVWPETRASWEVLGRVPEGFAIFGYCGQGLRMEAAVGCETVSEAEQVRAAIEELFTAGSSAVGNRLRQLADQVQQGQWKADEAIEYEKFLKLLAGALARARLEVVESTVWVRMAWKAAGQDLAERISTLQQALQRDWQQKVSKVIAQQEGRLLQGLEAYIRAEGHFPPGAEGGPLWDPATRLSWIALMLPYLGHADWYQQLHLRYPWNSLQNKAVVQQPLEEVLNPAFPQRSTQAGFPVTHYVGVGGLGEDAVDPKADPRRIGVFGFGRSLKPEEITDGLSYTIAIAGVSQRVGPWAAGGSATVRPFTRPPYVNGPDGFGTGQPHGMYVGMADGSVRFVSKDVDPRVLEMLATARGMERLEGIAWEADPRRMGAGKLPAAAPLESPGSPLGSSQPEGKMGKMVPHVPPAPSLESKSAPSIALPGHPGSAPSAPEVSEKPAPQTRPRAKGISSIASKAEHQTETEARLAQKVVSIELPDLPLRRAVSLVEALGGVRISYDLDEMELAGVSLDRPVRLQQTNTTLAEVLEAILRPLGLVSQIDGKDILISRPIELRQQWRIVRYEVSDLAVGQTGPEDLARLLERFVLPESWEQNGGSGKIEIRDESLLILQTDLGHQRVAEFLEKLRVARGLPLRIDPNRKDLSLQSRLAQLQGVLQRPITANFSSPTQLGEILRYLEQLAEVNIVVDWIALRAEGLEADIPARLRVHQQPLAQALTTLLEPLGLTWRIAGPELLEVTSRTAAKMRLEVEFYSGREAIAALGSAKALLKAIKAQVGKGSWQDTHGPGALYFDEPSQYLIVLQSPLVHRELERFLANFQPPPSIQNPK